MKRRVVITGLGAVTAAGEGAAALWEAVVNGRSGIDYLSGSAAGDSWNPIGGFIRGFEPEKFVPQRKSLKVMARDIQLAIAGASLAMRDAEAEALADARDRLGVVVGSGVLDHEVDELAASVITSIDGAGRLDLKRFGEDGLSALFPLWLLKYLPNMPACHISIFGNLQGPNNTITTGASSGLQAVGEAYRILQRGSADLMLAGAAESKLNPVGFSHYQILGVLENVNGDPKKMYKPFDGLARGFVAGEASAFVVLEELEHAKKRGARIYAEITGFGSSSSRGRATAMRAALAESGITPGDVDYLQASGIGLPEEDALEGEAIRAVFNGAARKIGVHASKPVTGFAAYPSGVLDLMVALLALRHGAVPPTLNVGSSAGKWEFDVVRGNAVEKKMSRALVNAFGFGGQCSTLAVRKEEGVS